MSRLFFGFLLLLAGRWLWRATRKAKIGRCDASCEQIVCCVECGIYVPLSQAKRMAKQVFCCHEHAYSRAQHAATHETATQK